jgi:hypothetical protein
MDEPAAILKNTRTALTDLREQLLELQHLKKIAEKDSNDDDYSMCSTVTALEDGESPPAPDELWSCRFNSGLFAVDWEDTRRIVEEEMKSLGKTIHVISPAKANA